MGFAGPDQAAMQAGNPGRTFGRAAPSDPTPVNRRPGGRRSLRPIECA
jgi:hypothetical protein